MNDPLGDMLTRIRNAQMRGKSTVRTPASKLRAWVLDVLKAEGYIRGYEPVTSAAGHDELEISLKYFEGTPIPTSVLLVGVLAAAAWQGRVGAEVLGGAWQLMGWTLHPLVLLFALSGTLMISKTLRIPKF